MCTYSSHVFVLICFRNKHDLKNQINDEHLTTKALNSFWYETNFDGIQQSDEIGCCNETHAQCFNYEIKFMATHLRKEMNKYMELYIF